ncbi:MAG: M20/M25/M40 family metallo-hydrolase [bacterium]|nr:M20/M25/M40 family metallo-hydrolase [bacterium]
MKNMSTATLFLDLVRIPSPSGEEKSIGRFIQRYLDGIGIKTRFDHAGRKNNSNSGNLIAKIPGTTTTTILFVAHMDTVEKGDRSVKPKLMNGVIVSNGDTILGADNKASIACILSSITEILSLQKRPTVIFIFSTREEAGKMGVRYVDIKDHIDAAFVIDGEGSIGRFIYKSLGQIPFEVTFHGKASHAAINPEEGIHAMKIAADFISHVTLGRGKNGSTMNVGKIIGGTATNIIPDKVTVMGEVRAFSQEEMTSILKKIEEVAKSASEKFGGRYTVVMQPDFGAPPMIGRKTSPIVSIAKKATKAAGLPFKIDAGSFTGEGNYLAEKGYSVLTVCRGGKYAHSSRETIAVRELEDLKRLILALVSTSANEISI